MTLIDRARKLANDHERFEQGGGAANQLRELADALAEATALLREVRADGVMEEWAGDLPKRIDAMLNRLGIG